MDQPIISSDLIRGHIDTIILHSLLSSDKYAQQINQTIEEKCENKYTINQATLYSSLKRLEGLKFVSSYWFDAADGRRKFFKITEKGKVEVEKNLSSWAFSRSIIDNLVDYIPPTQDNKTAVEVGLDNNEKTFSNGINGSNTEKITNLNIDSCENFSNTQTTSESFVGKLNDSVLNEDEKKEINYKNIINGLIKTQTNSAKQNDATKQNIEIINQEPDEKPKFNETIDCFDNNSKKININDNNVDYSNLILNARNCGYKIKISSSNSAKSSGNIFINKIDFFSILCVLLAVVIEVLFCSFTIYKDKFSPFKAIMPILLMIALTIFFAVKYCNNPQKSNNKLPNSNRIIASIIVALNLLLLTLVVDFLVDIDFSSLDNIMSYIIAPIIVCIDIVLFFIFEFVFSKSKLKKSKPKF